MNLVFEVHGFSATFWISLTRALTVPLCAARPARKLPLVNQDPPDVIDIGERRAGLQQIAGGREEGGSVVVVEEGTGLEAERRHPSKRRLIDDGAGGIGGPARAAVGAVGVAGERCDAGRILEQVGQRQRIFL